MDAINSVYKQTYTNWEIILVDDGSTDISREIYKELEKDERIHIYYNDKNYGCGYTKRRCADLAHGEICGFLDPDDTLMDDAMQVMVEAHQANKNVSIVSSRYHCCDENLKILSISRLLQLPSDISYLEYADYAPECFASYKNKYYHKTDGINKDMKMGVDQDLYFHLEEVGEWYVLDKVLYNYRVGVGISHVDDARLWNLLVRLEAAGRRHLSVEKQFAMLKKVCDEYCVTAVWSQVSQKENEMHSSYAYRVGKVLLIPFSWLRHSVSSMIKSWFD